MNYIPVICNETGNAYYWPLVLYSYTENEANGYNSSIYQAINLDTYQSKLRQIFKATGADYAQRTFSIVFNDTISTTNWTVNYFSNLGAYRVTLKYSTTPEGEPSIGSNILVPATYTGFRINTRSDVPVRARDDGLNKIVSSSPKAYYIVKEDGSESSGNDVFCYDPESNHIGIVAYFGTVSTGGPAAYANVIANPGFIRPYENKDLLTRIGVPVFHIPLSDPLSPGDLEGGSGADGDFDYDSDSMGFPDLPTISAVDTGFVSLYNPTTAQIRNLASYMWSDAFSLDSFKKLFSDPMDCILGLSIVPVAVPDGITTDIKVGNITTNVEMTRAASQFVKVYCGSLNIKEFWGSALDYSPNTKIHIFLPYIGFRQLDVDEVMNNPISLEYTVDILSGACVASIKTLTTDGHEYIAYQFEGNCAVQIPVTSSDWSSLLSMTARVTGTIVGAAATGGATAGVQAGAVAAGLSNTVNGVMNSKPTIAHSGSFSGGGGQIGTQTPFLVKEMPRQSLPADYNSFEGYPLNATKTLGSLSGYTVIEAIHLEGINATDGELSEIESLLRGGVIL